MAGFMDELAAWMATNVTGITRVHSSGMPASGDLFINTIPDGPGTISGLYEMEILGNNQGDDRRLVCQFRVVGANAETVAFAAFDWIRDRSGTVTIPGPFDLTSWHVLTMRPGNEASIQSRPRREGRTETDEEVWAFEFLIIYRAK